MVLPKPTFTFTVPSLYDNTPLDCRLYLPETPATGQKERGKGAVLAHPYAPLGGCYDDHLVGSIGRQLLKHGWTVGTFNFRGAGGSKGRTSWSGKPELEDYVSFAGLVSAFLTFMNYEDSETASPTAESSQSTRPPISLLLGGYSYGSLIVSHLPPTSAIVDRFVAPENGSAAAEIRLRATHLSTQAKILSPKPSPASSPRKHKPYGQNLSMSIGGEESPRRERRRSKESSRHSLDSLPGKLRDLSIKHKSHRDRDEQGHKKQPIRKPVSECDITISHTAYLLVSPLLPPVSTGLAFGLHHHEKVLSKRNEVNVLYGNDCLIVFGDQDFFTSSHRLRKWIGTLQQHSGGKATSCLVEGAGHFWGEEGAVPGLLGSIDSFLQS